MSLRRTAGGTLSAAGVVLAALFATPEPPHWGAFAASLAVLALGLLLLRQRGDDRKRSATVRVEGPQQWADQLQGAAVRLENLVATGPNIESAEELDRLRLNVFVPFAEVGEKLAATLGLQRYADVMIAFARSERALNRGLSALVDGYPGEATTALREALVFLRQTTDLLLADS